MPHGLKPKTQRLSCIVEKGSGSYRGLAQAIFTLKQPPCCPSDLATAAHGAHNPIWPSEANEIVNAGFFCRKPLSEISKVYRKILHVLGYYMLCHQESSAYPRKFIMMEPLLGPMPRIDLTGINWVVVGGETNSKGRYRPIKEEWIADIRDQVKGAGLYFMFKHWPGRSHNSAAALLDGIIWNEYPPSLTSNIH